MAFKKPTLNWNLFCGEGSIGNIENFRQLDALLRCDLLEDWINGLQAEHERAQNDFIVWCEETKNAHQP